MSSITRTSLSFVCHITCEENLLYSYSQYIVRFRIFPLLVTQDKCSQEFHLVCRDFFLFFFFIFLTCAAVQHLMFNILGCGRFCKLSDDRLTTIHRLHPQFVVKMIFFVLSFFFTLFLEAGFFCRKLLHQHSSSTSLCLMAGWQPSSMPQACFHFLLELNYMSTFPPDQILSNI